MNKLGRGDLIQIVLRIVLDQNGTGYGMTIHEAIEDALGKSVALSAVYTVLDRCEDKGYVRSWLGEPEAIRGGRAKKFFEITGEGQKALTEALPSGSTSDREVLGWQV